MIPPSDRSEEFKMNQSEISAQLMTNDGTLFSTPYPLMGMGEEDDVGKIPLCCHLVIETSFCPQTITWNTVDLVIQNLEMTVLLEYFNLYM